MAQVNKSEKLTINIGLIDLGQIDLLVDERTTPRTARTSSAPRSAANSERDRAPWTKPWHDERSRSAPSATADAT